MKGEDTIEDCIAKFASAEPAHLAHREAFLALVAVARKLGSESKASYDKWWGYEKDYILPCFKWAAEYGIDLHKLVSEGKGNCVELLVRALGENVIYKRRYLEFVQACSKEGGPCYCGCHVSFVDDPSPEVAEERKLEVIRGGAAREAWRQIPPHDMVLYCPQCKQQHLDIGEFATRVHRKHKCENTPAGVTGCGHLWVPHRYATRGVPSDTLTDQLRNAHEALRSADVYWHKQHDAERAAHDATKSVLADVTIMRDVLNDKLNEYIDKVKEAEAQRRELLNHAENVIEHVRYHAQSEVGWAPTAEGETMQLIRKYDAAKSSPSKQKESGISASMFDIERLVALILHETPSCSNWRRHCEIITEYRAPFADKGTPPKCVVRCGESFLRHSAGPKQGHFWDIYGDNYLTPELAILALSDADPPPWVTAQLEKRNDNA